VSLIIEFAVAVPCICTGPETQFPTPSSEFPDPLPNHPPTSHFPANRHNLWTFLELRRPISTSTLHGRHPLASSKCPASEPANTSANARSTMYMCRLPGNLRRMEMVNWNCQDEYPSHSLVVAGCSGVQWCYRSQRVLRCEQTWESPFCSSLRQLGYIQ
jgi:hypothetical protein